MIYLWVKLIVMLLLILVSSQLFTNALEHFGQKIKISAGVTGSIFAAIATALPETSVPIIAMVAGTDNVSVNEEISVGAILGAPLMLSTLAVFFMALSVIKMRGIKGSLIPELTGFTRDLNFFLVAFFLAAIAMFLPRHPIGWRFTISGLLILLYITYVAATLRASKQLVIEGHGVLANEPMILTRIGLKNNANPILIQLLLSLVLLLIGAKGFIDGIENISIALNVSALILSLLIIPIATELPEKINSILWIRKNKDTLACGNISGAMTFQGTLLPALGILLTPWQPSREVLTGVMITLIAAVWLRLHMSEKGLSIRALFINGSLYFIYLLFMFI
ncbi:MAG TPA: sodium:calcium antiporter [Gammaproteobacteria bacterium]|nr:sodium:calcium antiporter [Gammaproteobacteria bacterium]